MHLAWGALRAMTLNAWRRREAGHAFVDSFTPEGLVPVSRKGRETAHRAGGCLACGSCEHLGLSPRSILDASRDLSMLSRSARDIRVLSGLDRRALETLESTCPASIPFGEIALMLEHMLDRTENLG